MDKIIEMNGLKLHLLDQTIKDEIIPNPELADVWIIDNPFPGKVKAFLKQVIRSTDPQIYLKPIFLQQEYEERYRYMFENIYLQELCDGYIDNLQLTEKTPLLDRISSYLNKYKHLRANQNFTEREAILQSCFDYYYTRQRAIQPIRSHVSLSGYGYPRLEAYFYSIIDGDKYSRLMLKEAFSKQLLTRSYVDTLHLCSHCGGGFLNYREVCPKCSSHDLRVRQLIHHFRCAYIGPKDDFWKDDHLACPKCSSILRNVGVDYDSPGFVFICKNEKCNHQFQHPPILVSCVECSTSQSPSDLKVKKIYKYTFTEKSLTHFLSID